MGGRATDVVLLDKNGKRCDGRTVNQTREVTIKAVSYTHLTLPTNREV